MEGNHPILKRIQSSGFLEKLSALQVSEQIKQEYLMEALERGDTESVLKKIEQGQRPQVPKEETSYLLLKATAMTLFLDLRMREKCNLKQEKR